MFRKKIYNLSFVLFFLIFSSSVAFSISKKNVKIDGNTRVSSQTILDYLSIEKKISSIDSEVLNNFQKTLLHKYISFLLILLETR